MHPLIKQLFMIMKSRKLSMHVVSLRSGYSHAMIGQWSAKINGARLAPFTDVLDSLGYELVIRDKKTKMIVDTESLAHAKSNILTNIPKV